jgi:hypothetical protein
VSCVCHGRSCSILRQVPYSVKIILYFSDRLTVFAYNRNSLLPRNKPRVPSPLKLNDFEYRTLWLATCMVFAYGR